MTIHLGNEKRLINFKRCRNIMPQGNIDTYHRTTDTFDQKEIPKLTVYLQEVE